MPAEDRFSSLSCACSQSHMELCQQPRVPPPPTMAAVCGRFLDALWLADKSIAALAESSPATPPTSFGWKFPLPLCERFPLPTPGSLAWPSPTFAKSFFRFFTLVENNYIQQMFDIVSVNLGAHGRHVSSAQEPKIHWHA